MQLLFERPPRLGPGLGATSRTGSDWGPRGPSPREWAVWVRAASLIGQRFRETHPWWGGVGRSLALTSQPRVTEWAFRASTAALAGEGVLSLIHI